MKGRKRAQKKTQIDDSQKLISNFFPIDKQKMKTNNYTNLVRKVGGLEKQSKKLKKDLYEKQSELIKILNTIFKEYFKMTDHQEINSIYEHLQKMKAKMFEKMASYKKYQVNQNKIIKIQPQMKQTQQNFNITSTQSCLDKNSSDRLCQNTKTVFMNLHEFEYEYARRDPIRNSEQKLVKRIEQSQVENDFYNENKKQKTKQDEKQFYKQQQSTEINQSELQIEQSQTIAHDFQFQSLKQEKKSCLYQCEQFIQLEDEKESLLVNFQKLQENLDKLKQCLKEKQKGLNKFNDLNIFLVNHKKTKNEQILVSSGQKKQIDEKDEDEIQICKFYMQSKTDQSKDVLDFLLMRNNCQSNILSHCQKQTEINETFETQNRITNSQKQIETKISPIFTLPSEYLTEYDTNAFTVSFFQKIYLFEFQLQKYRKRINSYID